MNRVTMEDLERIVSRLNKLTGMPEAPYSEHKGKFTANIGNYHLDGAYGGWKLVQMQTDGGGIKDVLNSGFVSKRELYALILAYSYGVENEKRAK